MALRVRIGDVPPGGSSSTEIPPADDIIVGNWVHLIDHWTGADKATYTTATAHWIDKKTWILRSAVLDFKVFEGSTTGERICEELLPSYRNFRAQVMTQLFLTRLAT
jgi:hypothetical protein